MLGVFGSARYLDFLSYGHNGKMSERVDRTRTRDDDLLVKAMRHDGNQLDWGDGEMLARDAGLLVWLFVIGVLIVAYLRRQSVPTFDQYQAQHPNLVNNGRVTCRQCGGGSIYLRVAGRSFSGVVTNVHVCRTCGTNLYRSTSR